jgi:soluble lytic murein transglycosylase-like protein
LCGAMSLPTYGVYASTSRLTDPPPPKLPLAFKIPPAPTYSLDDVVRVLAHKHGLRQGIVRSIIAAESRFDQKLISRRGAVGLMQLMPDTAREYGVDPTIAEQNVEGGTRYLSSLMHRYRHCSNQLQRTIAAYNAGPASVHKYRGVPPFRETRDYVKRVLALYQKYGDGPSETWKSAEANRSVRAEETD